MSAYQRVQWRVCPSRAATYPRAFRPAVVLSVCLAVMIAAFLPIDPTVDPLTGGLTPGRIYELGLLLAGIGMLTGYALVTHSPIIHVRPAFVLLTCFTLWAYMSSFWSPSPVLSAGKSIELWLLALAACLFASIVHCNHIDEDFFPNIILSAIIIVIVAFLFINILFWGTPFPLIEREVGRYRLVLGYTHPLTVASLISMAAIALCASRLRLILKVITLPIILILLYLTNARAAGVAIALALLVMRYRGAKAIGRMVWVLALVFAVASYFLFADMYRGGDLLWLIRPMLLGAGDEQGEDLYTLNNRTFLWSYVVQLIQDRPITGHGYFASRYLLMESFVWAGHAHNSFLETTLSTGLIGLSLLLLFTIRILALMCRTGDQLFLGLSIFSLLVGSNGYYLFMPGVLMLILLVVVVNLDLRRREVPSRWKVGVSPAMRWRLDHDAGRVRA